MILSVLIPATPKRYLSHLWPLWRKLEGQVNALQNSSDVELLVFLDNRQRTIGEKRDALVQMSRGEFVTFVDDDDDVSDDYISTLVSIAKCCTDATSVITFDQRVIVNGVEATCQFSLAHPNERFAQPTFRRNAWHVCAWRGSLARRFRFPANNYGEDWGWAKHLVAEATGEVRVSRTLHTYRYDERVSEAPPPSNN